jgi:ADP-ribose pyrophosphatase
MKTKRNSLHKTPFLELVSVEYTTEQRSGVWFGVTRTNASLAVVIAAITKDNELILVEQPRPMLSASTVELPAGLADIKDETILETAKRELLEETGYECKNLKIIVGGQRGLSVSSGLTDERLVLVFGSKAVKTAEPLKNEETTPILVPLSEAFNFLRELEASGREVDYKLFGTVSLLEREVGRGH